MENINNKRVDVIIFILCIIFLLLSICSFAQDTSKVSFYSKNGLNDYYFTLRNALRIDNEIDKNYIALNVIFYPKKDDALYIAVRTDVSNNNTEVLKLTFIDGSIEYLIGRNSGEEFYFQLDFSIINKLKYMKVKSFVFAMNRDEFIVSDFAQKDYFMNALK